MRGKQGILPLGLEEMRITPARAGKTKSTVPCKSQRPDHPRACGENRHKAKRQALPPGSPPRVRGKHPSAPGVDGNRRITPARAGKTHREWQLKAPKTDHPRACGENGIPTDTAVSRAGSPPRVRGKRKTDELKKYPERITPARAGKTFSGRKTAISGRDHPRACGENTSNEDNYSKGDGSPPRVRGKRKFLINYIIDFRITPARAGKTPFRYRKRFLRADHPRACGENPSGTDKSIANPGSPPRVRGKLIVRSLLTLRLRITPARAGKTAAYSGTYSSFPDHPRACGENSRMQGMQKVINGSPPRVRGKQYPDFRRPDPARITPARAGKTLKSR